MSLFSELRRRNVIRVAVAYLAGVWVVLQVAELVLDGFNSPAWILQSLLIASALCFPLVVVLAWFYELTPEGVRDADSEEIEPNKFLGRKIDFVIIGVLVLAVIFLVVNNYLPDDGPVAETVSEDNSIAVLPFSNRSSDPEQQYFSHGISEELINLLTKVENLRVVARASAFAAAAAFADADRKSESDADFDAERMATLRRVGGALAARYLLEGSVQRQLDMVQINSFLTDTKTNTIIWSQSYNQEFSDIFSIQTDVASAIVQNLPITLTEQPPERGQPTNDAQAYELFLRARSYLNNGFRLEEARDAIDDALARDPAFAEAYELRSSIHWMSAGVILDAEEAQEKSGQDARQALEYDPSLVLAQVMSVAGDLDNYSLAAEFEAWERAARIEPNNLTVLQTFVFNLRKAGYVQEGLRYSRRLLETDPYTDVAHDRLQTSLLACLRTEEAIADIGGDIATRLGVESATTGTFDEDLWVVGEIALINNQDDMAIGRFTAELVDRGLDFSWVGELVEGARDPVAGVAYLDSRIPEIVAAVRAAGASDAPSPDAESKALWLSGKLARLYLLFGFLDRYYEIIWAQGLSDSEWSNTDDLIAAGVVYPDLGFTGHPRYVETAQALGIVDVWELRGPPDYCRKDAGAWECSQLRTPCPEN